MGGIDAMLAAAVGGVVGFGTEALRQAYARRAKRDASVAEADTARIDDLARWRRELMSRVDAQDKRIEELRGENLKLEKAVLRLEERNLALERVLVDTAQHIEALIQSGVEDLGRVRSQLEVIATDLRASVAAGKEGLSFGSKPPVGG